ncbi:MAG: hypothetical protein JSS78_02665 [Bacteroidetes bacterium]|nr:hypothetical protein [Bacteroidota bacterium]
MARHNYFFSLIFILLGCALVHTSKGQSLATLKAAQRYEVDAKRMGVDVNSDDALPRSREFKRIDSTYYVGWMFEGTYKYNHAADFLGFKNASFPLEHALGLMERDYHLQLATRTSDLLTYMRVYKFQLDYTLTAYYLMNCYSNMELSEKVYSLLRRVIRFNFQRDFYMDAWNYLGWTVHRNRFYTASKYPFLQNSIDENEQLANKFLDSGMRKIIRDMPLNSKIFQPGYERQDKAAVYHYKAMLCSYNFKIDSANYYYNLLKKEPIFSHNNYGTFRAICGDFQEAAQQYQIESTNHQPDKRLQEWAYYLSILDIYKGFPQNGIELMKGMIQANGSTPGFGWYNIALARSEMYNGQLEEALRHINKAANFKELHIGTTLGQTHYDFSIQLLRLLQKINEIEAQKFERKDWWYHLPSLANLAQLTTEKYVQQFLIINQFAQNPERDRVVYKLFSTESTVSWDEIWFLIRDFTTDFFLERFQHELQNDERKAILKYFRYFLARLNLQKGNISLAEKQLNEVLKDASANSEYEQLLIARTLQAQAEIALQKKDSKGYQNRMNQLYAYYPQLIPFTSLTMPMQLQISGSAPEGFLNRLNQCNINFANHSSSPKAHLQFYTLSQKVLVQFWVEDSLGRKRVLQQSMMIKTPEDAVKLAYRLFGISEKLTQSENEKK